MGYLVLTRGAGQTIKIGSRIVLKVEDVGIKNVKVSFEVTSPDRRVKSFCLIHVGESVWEPLSKFHAAEIKLARIENKKVRLAINAPRDVLILRGEVKEIPAKKLSHNHKMLTLHPEGKGN